MRATKWIFIILTAIILSALSLYIGTVVLRTIVMVAVALAIGAGVYFITKGSKLMTIVCTLIMLFAYFTIAFGAKAICVLTNAGATSSANTANSDAGQPQTDSKPNAGTSPGNELDDANKHAPKLDDAGSNANGDGSSSQTDGTIPTPVAPARPNGNATTSAPVAETGVKPCIGEDGLTPMFVHGDFVMTVMNCTMNGNQIKLSGVVQYTGPGSTRISFDFMSIKDASGTPYTIERGKFGKQSGLGTSNNCDAYLSKSESLAFEVYATPDNGKGVTPYISMDVPVIVHEGQPFQVSFHEMAIQD